jgi:hypothetical protein
VSKLLPFGRPKRGAKPETLTMSVGYRDVEAPPPAPRPWGPDRPLPILPGEGEHAGSPLLDCHLAKGARRRRYWIRPSTTAGAWVAQVWFGDRQHRGQNLTALIDAQRVWFQYRTEILELFQDGWIVGHDTEEP